MNDENTQNFCLRYHQFSAKNSGVYHEENVSLMQPSLIHHFSSFRGKTLERFNVIQTDLIRIIIKFTLQLHKKYSSIIQGSF